MKQQQRFDQSATGGSVRADFVTPATKHLSSSFVGFSATCVGTKLASVKERFILFGASFICCDFKNLKKLLRTPADLHPIMRCPISFKPMQRLDPDIVHLAFEIMR
jgi:hypothetical protein